jgi:diacylglycerol kinase (ATP)
MTCGFELFDRIVLIYSPVNRRVPLTLAESVRRELGHRLPDVPVALQATQHAGHARELASDAATTGRPLIIAVSGDGVYNEVVNGVLDASGTGALAAVAAGGNANDHRRSTRRMPLLDAIVAAHARGRARHLDLLRLTVRSAGGEWNQYAHSYIVFGLTPLMAIGLKRDRKRTVAELLSVLRIFSTFMPVEILRTDGRRELYDSLVFANVARIAKYGRAEHLRPARRRAVRGGVASARPPMATVDSVSFQIDGEVFHLAPHSGLIIDCAPHALTTVG